MFGILGSLVKTAASVVAVPVAVVADVAEAITLKQQDSNYTERVLRNVGSNVKNVAKEVDKTLSI